MEPPGCQAIGDTATHRTLADLAGSSVLRLAGIDLFEQALLPQVPLGAGVPRDDHVLAVLSRVQYAPDGWDINSCVFSDRAFTILYPTASGSWEFAMR